MKEWFTVNWASKLLWLTPFLSVCAYSICNTAEARTNPERWYQELWCPEHYGEVEVRLADNTRVDCLTEDYAIEFDFANKWAEAIGQAQHYAAMTDRRPGIVLIIEDEERDQRHIKRLQQTLDNICPDVKLWLMTP